MLIQLYLHAWNNWVQLQSRRKVWQQTMTMLDRQMQMREVEAEMPEAGSKLHQHGAAACACLSYMDVAGCCCTLCHLNRCRAPDQPGQILLDCEETDGIGRPTAVADFLSCSSRTKHRGQHPQLGSSSCHAVRLSLTLPSLPAVLHFCEAAAY